ncbi:uncharacterized protein LOC113791187 isoform X1 [Dermatophagoides pteronyssinus]|uniref:uncharacterized protein LOC113791187 isoform X1 n=1 Tax=Dermatophagoides pteronyssinus TaxID=6956 RepID=UPI003F673064
MENIDNKYDDCDKKLAASIAIKSFFGPIILSLFFSIILFDNNNQLYFQWQYFFPLLLAIIFITFILLFSQFYSNRFYVVVILITLGLSSVFSFGLHLAVVGYLYDNQSSLSPIYHSFGLYLMILSFFHYGEFQSTSLINNNNNSITIQAFLLDNSIEYHLAIAISLTEFCIESWYFPNQKFIFHPYLTYTGLIICIVGDSLRKLAMYTAGHNFNHIIQIDHYSDHQLITTGIYSIFRHPSYVGWFYWSIGTQILLQNPISLVGYAIVSWRFFKQRIQFEEITLINFFGPKYLIYKKEVPTGLPWIDGY